MKLRFRLPVIYGVLTFLSAFLLAYSAFRSIASVLEQAQEDDLQQAARLIESRIKDEADRMAGLAALVRSMPSVQKAFRGGDRRQISDILYQPFLLEKQQFGVSEVLFHLPPATCFLRLFEPGVAIGEDHSTLREMIVTANRLKEPQRGLEIGINGLSIRAVDLIKDAQGFIGTVEVSSDFNLMLKDLKRILGFDGGVLIDAQLMASRALRVSKPDPDKVIAGLQNVDATNWQVIRPLLTPDLLRRAHHVYTDVESIDGVTNGTVLVPLHDFRGELIGAVIAVKSFDQLQKIEQAGLVKLLALALLQAALLFGLGYVVFAKFKCDGPTEVSSK